MKKTVRVFLNRRQLSAEIGLNEQTVYRGLRKSGIRPDGMLLNGDPLFANTPARLQSIREQLSSTDTIAA